MKLSVILACAWTAAFAGDGRAAGSQQCLSAAELVNVGRMASVMAMGAAVQRCGQCLGPERYPQTLHTYEAAGLLADFWKAQKDLESAGEKLTSIDQIVRDSARKFAVTLSGDCDACRRTADTLQGLSISDARERFYRAETDILAKAPEVKTCP